MIKITISYFRYIAILALIFIAGCSKPTSYHDFMLHPGSIETALAKCDAMSLEQASQDITCRNAARALRDFYDLATEIQANPGKFGVKILRAEMRLAKLAQNKDNARGRKKYQKQYLKVQILQAAIAAVSAPV